MEKGRAGEATPSRRTWCRTSNYEVGGWAGGGDLVMSQDSMVMLRRRVTSL
jgi:hypothetical protein